MAVTPVLIDTNAYAAYKRGDQAAVEIFRHVERIGISAIVLGELLAGFAAGNRERRNRRRFDLPAVADIGDAPAGADLVCKVRDPRLCVKIETPA
jgi:predicted nucleic acid-binding protein